MIQRNWGQAKSRHESIRSLRDVGSTGPRLPDFFNESDDSGQDAYATGSDAPSPSIESKEETSQGSSVDSSFLFRKIPQGGALVIMNKISFISIIFGLLFIGVLLYAAGILTAYYILPGGPKAVSVALGGGSGGQLPKIELPSKEDIAHRIERAVSKLGQSPQRQDVEKAIQTAVKAITPEFAQPKIQEIITPNKVETGFTEGAKRTPSDSDAGQFTVQAKVYGDGAWAMQLARRLKEEGYGAYIVRVKEKYENRLNYHTRVGVFGDYLAANSMVRTLREMGNRSATVVLIARGEDRLVP